jgi:cytochrome c556
MKLCHLFAFSRFKVAIGAAAVAASMLGAAAVAPAQDQSAAIANDAIVARKTVMNALSDRMDTVEAMIASGKKLDLDEGHANADAISVFMMAFPHLFPSSTNQWKPNVDKDPATDTFAAPELWTNFADFYQQATAASKAAFDASRADDESAFKASIAQLRKDCNTCHTAYLKAN